MRDLLPKLLLHCGAQAPPLSGPGPPRLPCCGECAHKESQRQLAKGEEGSGEKEEDVHMNH